MEEALPTGWGGSGRCPADRESRPGRELGEGLSLGTGGLVHQLCVLKGWRRP